LKIIAITAAGYIPSDLGLYIGYNNVTAVRNCEASNSEWLIINSSAGSDVGTRIQ
jgi:hypothetical protein